MVFIHFQFSLYLDSKKSEAFSEWLIVLALTVFFIILSLLLPWPLVTAAIIVVACMNYHKYVIGSILDLLVSWRK